MRIAIGSDHRGDAATSALAEHLAGELGHEVSILGATGSESRDYPDAAFEVASAVSRGHADRGILVCGSGIGMAIAANKVDGVRAATVRDEHEAEMSRRHNDANVLCLSAERTDVDTMEAIAETWLATNFEGGRHERRVEKIAAIERANSEQRTANSGSC